MTVKVVGKSPKYVKRVVCRSCSHELEYTEQDEKYHHYTDYGGGSSTRYWIDCPVCLKEVVTKDI